MIDPRIAVLKEKAHGPKPGPGWRHDFHAHPVLPCGMHRGAGLVVGKLHAFGREEMAERRFRQIGEGAARISGATVRFDRLHHYPANVKANGLARLVGTRHRPLIAERAGPAA